MSSLVSEQVLLRVCVRVYVYINSMHFFFYVCMLGTVCVWAGVGENVCTQAYVLSYWYTNVILVFDL